jgi:hypothetical protein
MASTNEIYAWLNSADTHLVTPPPSDTQSQPLKRKHTNSMALVTTSDIVNPKRRRTERGYEMSPSASQIGRVDPLDLTGQTTLSAVTNQSGISSPKRATSPTRETSIKLRTGSPAIAVDPISGLREKPPEAVRQLRDTLSNSFGTGFIPVCLKVRVCPLRFAMVYSG